MQQILDEIAKKIENLSDEELDKVSEAINERKKQIKKSKENVNPNIEWLKEHRDEYAGNYVALFEGELIAFGRTIKEADTKAKAKGYKKKLLTYVPAKDEVLWGGW